MRKKKKLQAMPTSIQMQQQGDTSNVTEAAEAKSNLMQTIKAGVGNGSIKQRNRAATTSMSNEQQ
jgi:hypothetical protein